MEKETNKKRAQYGTRGATQMRAYRMPLETIKDIEALADVLGCSRVQVLIDAVQMKKNAHRTD